MKVIFLDVDGVLNSYSRGRGGNISKGLLKKLRNIVWATDAKIVVSSSWRLFPVARLKLKRYLKYKGMEAFDWTIDLGDNIPRGDEITYWLEINANLGIESYVILDDMDEAEFEDHMYNFVQTDPDKGLTDQDVCNAIEVLIHGDEV